MNWLIVVLVGLGVAALLLRWFVNTNPSAVLRSGKVLVFLAVAALCLALAATGRVAAAVSQARETADVRQHGWYAGRRRDE